MKNLSDLRQTFSLILAKAVLEVFPSTLLVGGSSAKFGFYYDFVFLFAFKKEFFSLIEEAMRKILKEKQPFKKLEMVPANAADFLRFKKQPLRAYEVEKSQKSLVFLTQIGEFVDYSFALPLPHEGFPPVFKLLDFKERQEDEVVTRIFATGFFLKDELKAFLKQDVSFDPVDHKQLGEDLKLFAPLEDPGYWAFLPKGEAVREVLVKYWKEASVKQNFQFVTTPRKLSDDPSKEILETHLGLFKEGRFAEITYVNDEEAGFEGMLNPKGYFYDQEHIFCSEEDLLKETISSLQFILKIFKITGFEYSMVLCPHGVGRLGSSPLWKKRVQLFKKALETSSLSYVIDVEEPVFGGPRVEIRVKDDVGKPWACSFVKLECVLLQDLKLTNALLVRSTFGRFERFMALLLEHTKEASSFYQALERIKML